MEITFIFLATITLYLCISLVSYRAAVLLFFFFYPVYPRFFALGFGDEGFAFTGQRAMIFSLFGIFLLRAFWGSADVKYGYELMRKYRNIVIPLFIFVLIRLGGNIVTRRFDFGAVSALVSEGLLSIFVVYLIVATIKSYRDVFLLLGLMLAGLLLNQFAGIVEFVNNESIFPQTLDLQYEQARSDEELLAGKIRDNTYRAMGFFDSSNALGGLLVLTLPFLFVQLQTHLSTTRAVGSCIALILTLPVAVFTGSRTSLLFCLLIIAWHPYAYIARGLTRAGKIFLAILLGLFAIGALYLTASGYLEKMVYGKGYAGSTVYRWLQYVYGANAFIQSPIFGYGYSRNIATLVNIRPMDSFFLRIVLEGGLAALIAIGVFMTRGFKLAGQLLNPIRPKVDRVLAVAIRIVILSAAIMMIVQSMPQTRIYIFVAVALAIVIHNFGDELDEWRV